MGITPPVVISYSGKRHVIAPKQPLTVERRVSSGAEYGGDYGRTRKADWNYRCGSSAVSWARGEVGACSASGRHADI